MTPKTHEATFYSALPSKKIVEVAESKTKIEFLAECKFCATLPTE
jgi:hypothetical protein